MEKDHLSIKKGVKNLRNYSKIKTLARVPIAVSLCPAVAHELLEIRNIQ